MALTSKEGWPAAWQGQRHGHGCVALGQLSAPAPVGKSWLRCIFNTSVTVSLPILASASHASGVGIYNLGVQETRSTAVSSVLRNSTWDRMSMGWCLLSCVVGICKSCEFWKQNIIWWPGRGEGSEHMPIVSFLLVLSKENNGIGKLHRFFHYLPSQC